MKLSTRARVVKSNTVEVCFPRLVECQTGEFRVLGEHLSIVRDTNLNLSLEENSNSLEQDKNSLGRSYDDKNELRAVAKKWATEEETLLSQAKSQAQEILTQAKETLAQAEAELAQAQAEAQILHAEARAEAEKLHIKLHEEISQQAYAEGHAQGFAQGLREGKEQGEREAKKIKTEARDLFQLAKRAVQEELAKVDGTLLHLALKVSEKIVRANLKQHPEYLLYRIRALALLPEQREGWRLHVAPRDAEWMKNLPPDEILKIPLVEDETLSPGDCFLECSEGIFDARLEAQLDRFEQLLGEELRYDGLEQAGR